VAAEPCSEGVCAGPLVEGLPPEGLEVPLMLLVEPPQPRLWEGDGAVEGDGAADGSGGGQQEGDTAGGRSDGYFLVPRGAPARCADA